MKLPTTRCILFLASLTTFTQVAAAQTSPITPRPAHERLAVFEGTWRSTDSTDAAVFEDATFVLPCRGQKQRSSADGSPRRHHTYLRMPLSFETVVLALARQYTIERKLGNGGM